MDLSYLMTYIEVVKTSSMSKAARKLNLSQPAISNQIKNIERELGVCLIKRDRNNFELTDEGKRFFIFSNYVYQAHNKLLYDISLMKIKSGSKLVIISSPMGENYLPNVINEFRKSNPYIEITLKIIESARAFEEILIAENYIGICGTNFNIPEFNSFQILEDEIVAVVSSNHPFANEKSITISDLFGQTILMRQEFSYFSQELLKAGFNISDHHPKVVLGSTASLLEAVESNLGIAFLPHLAIKKQEAKGSLNVIEIDNFKLYWKLYCIYKKDEIMPDSNKLFIDFLKQRDSR